MYLELNEDRVPQVRTLILQTKERLTDVCFALAFNSEISKVSIIHMHMCISAHERVGLFPAKGIKLEAPRWRVELCYYISLLHRLETMVQCSRLIFDSLEFSWYSGVIHNCSLGCHAYCRR